MVAVPVLFCLVVFLSTGVSGKIYLNACSESYKFRCDNGNCLWKNQWCNGRNDCSDGSDEKYCKTYPEGSSCNDLHFQCDNGMCIPIQGYCDGYSSCSDQSDEKNCPCEELYNREENIQYTAYITSYRTGHKCFKISVNKAQYVDMKISATLKNRDCIHGNLTVYSTDEHSKLENFANKELISVYRDYNNNIDVFCPNKDRTVTAQKSLTYYKDVYIRYRSSFYVSNANPNKDSFNVTFQKVDLMCLRPDAFKCSKYSCVSPEKECDGNEDCEDGLDEQNCDNGNFSEKRRASMRIKSARWMRSQHDAEWAWEGNTHKAIAALHLAGDANFNGSNKDDDLIAKQLEMEVLTSLLRHKFDDKISSSELAAYINALLVICHDPRNFHGFDLVAALKKNLQKENSSFTPPFPYLTLCNAGEPITEEAVGRLLKILDISETSHGFVLEIQALATMALSCINNNENPNLHLEQNITEALNNFKRHQAEDGSFGNKYTTALVLQALIANNQESATDWNPEASIQFLFKNQEADGSFGDFLTTYLIMPVLNTKSLIDIGKINCSLPTDGDAVSDIRNRLGKKVVINYSLVIGNQGDHVADSSMVLIAPANVTVLELMMLAADQNPNFEFKIHEIRKKKFIYEISNLPNDPENNRFWFICRGLYDEMKPIPEQSPDKIKAGEMGHIIMWYKTLDSI